MNEAFYSVGQIARMLHMHPKTIQRYIREGKLCAAKIGKGWRVTGHDLSRFTEENGLGSATPQAPSAPRERARATAVIDIAAGSHENAQRILRSLNASMISKPPEYGRASLVTQYLETDGTVRLSLWGNLPFMTAVFTAVEAYLKQLEDGRVTPLSKELTI